MSFRFRFLTSLIVCALLFGTVSFFHPVSTKADDPENETVYDVTQFGAVPGDLEDIDNTNAKAFKKALSKALTEDSPITVIIPAGIWHIGQALKVYSNTTIKADPDAVIIADYFYDFSAIAYGEHLNDNGDRCMGETCTHGGYSQISNITIEGGTWVRRTDVPDGQAGAMMIFRLRHGENITIRNMVCKNASTHYFNLSSSKNVVVENVEFLDAQTVPLKSSTFWGSNGEKYGKMTPYNGVEAIHLDICDGIGENSETARPYDNTPCQNVTIQNCKFNNVWSGVGNHHTALSNRSSDISILNNTFTDIRWYAVSAMDFDNVTISGNICTNTNGIGLVSGSSNVLVENNRFLETKTAVNKFDADLKYPVLRVNTSVKAGATVIRNNNIINNGVTINKKSVPISNTDGIEVKACKNLTISNNIVNGSRGKGISVQTSKGSVIINNRVSRTAGDALFLKGEKGANCSASILNNTLSCATTLRKDSFKGFDLKLDTYTKDCQIIGNSLEHYAFSQNLKKSSYTGFVELPKLSKKKSALKKVKFTYSGSTVKPKITVKDTKGRVLKEGVHYTLSYTKNTNVGKATVIVNGMEIFSGQTFTKTFTIKAKKIKPKIKIKNKHLSYTGKVRKPKITVYDGKKKVPKRYYNVTYSETPIEQGKYQVKVTMKKNYKGNKTATFYIQ